jgi:subtilisin family serine protease
MTRSTGSLSSILFSAILAIQVLAGTAIAQPAPEPTLAPVHNEGAPNAIPGQYIVVFKPDTRREAVLAAQNTVKKFGGTVGHTYTAALIGFSAKLPPEALKALRATPGVAYIEADQVGSLNTIQPPNPPTNPPTGLDRIDRRLLPLNNTYTYSETGVGVHVYVIDTGIRAGHTEFGGRVSGGVNTMLAASGTDDCHGHGTHVAGTIGGVNYGIAKQVFLHPVRAGDCANTYLAPVIAGVDWVTNNRVLPAVVNLSSGFAPSPALFTAVTNSIASPSGVTYVVAAGNSNADACNTSPALVPTAITVGAVDPANDTRAGFSNFGTCLDLFAPGVNILSAWNTNDTATNTISGTSMAAPHVTGVAARYLQTHPAAAPADVWTAIHNADDIFGTTAGWAGIISPGAGSPNELLHWGSLNDGFNDGDPHLTTVDGVHYDFQSAGEFVSLRDGNGLQIQTRQTPVASAPPIANAYTGLASCVSLNTAVAARVGAQRVTYQPNISGVPDPSGLQLRVDGVLTTLPASGLNLALGGRVVKSSAGDGIEIDFPDGTVLIVTPGWWASQSKWYLHVSVFHTPASEGIMGAIAPGSWLPALPSGTSLGPKPAALHQRYVDLNQKFADAWRVTDATSLFDYAPGTSTATFTLKSWPPESPPCVLPESTPVKPVNLEVAQLACRAVVGKNRKEDCVFDVRVTGNAGFAKTYLLSEKIQAGSTTTTVTDDQDPTQAGEWVTFTAIVAPSASAGRRIPTGTVQFTFDGSKVGAPVKLDSKGRATWETSRLKVGIHRVAASYIPSQGSVFLASTSLEKLHSVRRCFCESATVSR